MSPNASWILVFWMALIGGVIGSFLNVVVYRLPLGMSIVHPPSHCPKCGKAIRWFDNVPVFGWLMLRGRCRHCGNPISPRYPTVEAIVAGMFALLAAVEFVSEGANLPHRAFPMGAALIREWSLGQVYATYLYHMLLLCTLVCAALIEYDGNRAPRGLYLPAIAVGLAAPVVWPWLRPIAAWTPLPASVAGIVDGLAGVAVGTLLGGILLWTQRIASPRDRVSTKKTKRLASRPSIEMRPSSLFFSLVSVAVFLGWQSAAIIAVITAIIDGVISLLARLARRQSKPALLGPTILLTSATLVWILCWARAWNALDPF